MAAMRSSLCLTIVCCLAGMWAASSTGTAAEAAATPSAPSRPGTERISGDLDGGISVVCSDLASTRRHWAGSPFAGLWAYPQLAATRKRLNDLADGVVAGGGGWLLLADATTARCDGRAVPDGKGAWQFQATLPATLTTAVAALTQKTGNPPQGHLDRGGWTWSWDAAHIETRFGGRVTPGAALSSHGDLDLAADIPVLCRQGGDQPSSELFTALGLVQLRYQAGIETSGLADRWIMPGFRPPLAAIAREDLAGLPAQPWAVMALRVDGERFAALIAQLRAVPEVADLCDWYARGPAAHLGTPESLARALHGTMLVCAVPAVPFPDLAVSLPANEAADALIDGIARLLAIDSAAARTSCQQIPLPGPWPTGLCLRRGTRWALSTSEQLATQLALQAGAAPLPAAVEAGIGTGGLVYVDTVPVMSACSQFASLALNNLPPEQKANAEIARDLYLAAARSAMPIDAVVRVDGQGTSISGHFAMVAGMIPAIALTVGAAGSAELMNKDRKAAARAQLMALHARALKDGWPATTPAEPAAIANPPRRLAGAAWSLYLPPGDDAPGDQPVVISDPRYLGDHCLWLTKDGRTPDASLNNARALWEAAQRLAQRGGPCSAADWAEPRRRYREKRYDDAKVVAHVEANYAIFAPPAPWAEIDAKAVGKDWDHVWQQPRRDMLFGIIAEQVTVERTTQWLHDFVLEHKRTTDPKLTILEESAITVSGQPAQRMRIDTTINGYHAYFDHTVFVHHGYIFQLVCWCGAKTTDADALATEAAAILDRFALIDAERYAPGYVMPPEPLAALQSPRMPLSIDLSGLGWASAAVPKNANAHIEMRARQPSTGAYTYLISADCGGRMLSDRALVHGMFALLNIQEQAVTEERTLTTPLGPTITLRYPMGEGKDALCLPCLDLPRRRTRRGIDRQCTAFEAKLPDAVGDAVFSRCQSPPPSTRTTLSDHLTDGDFAASIGEYLNANKRHQEALPWLIAALEQPRASIPRVQAVLNCYCQVERWQEAQAWYEAHAEPFADNLAIASFKPWFQVKLGHLADAVACYRVLFAAGWKDEEDFAAYIDALHTIKPAEVEAAFAANPVPAHTSAGHRLRARLLGPDGKLVEAENELRGAIAAKGDDLALSEALADNLIDQEKPTEAREFLRGILADHARAAGLWHLAGVADYRSDRFREATMDFRTELEISPTAPHAHEFLDAIDRRLGKGDTSRISRQIAPVAGIDELTPSGKPSPAGGAFALRATAISWSGSAGFLRSERRVIAVPDQGACETFSTERFAFDPGSEEFAINHIIVRDAAGAVVAEGKIDDWYVLDDHDDGMATTKKVVSVPIPGLHPGCVIDCLVTRRRSHANDAFPFTEVDLAGRYPTLLSVLSVQAPAGSLAAVAGGDLRLERDGDRLQARITDLPGRHHEPLVPYTHGDEAVVWLGSPSRTWAQLGKDYLAQHSRLLVDSPALAAQATSTIAGATSHEAQIAALADLVQARTTYNAIEFGRRGIIPQSAALTLDRRLGDCKDHALLLQRLLAAAGVTAHLALVPHEETLLSAMPDLDQFDHVVVVVPGSGDRPQVLDATAKGLDLSLVPIAVAGCQLLLLDPAGPRLVQAPGVGPSRIAIERTWIIDPHGAVSAEEQVTMTGYFASAWRNRLTGKQPEDRRHEIRDVLGPAVSAVTALEVADLDQPRRPLRLTIAYSLREPLARQGARFSGQLPEPWFACTWDWTVQRGEIRQRPFALHVPLTLDLTSRIRPPPSLVAAIPSAPADDADDFMTFHAGRPSGAAGADAGSTASFSIQQQSGTFAPARYAAWCDRVDALGRRLQVQVALAPPDAK